MPRKKTKELEQEVQENTNSIALMQQDFDYMKSGIDEIKESIKEFRHETMNNFVTKDQFEPIKKDVNDLKNIYSWVTKVVFGSIIVAILTFLGLKRD